MPKAPGIAIRNSSALTFDEPTQVTLYAPSGVVDNDLLVAGLCHKGAGFATWPAGWTLIQRDVSGSTRGELYWKRAASEPTEWVITGTTYAVAAVLCYEGALLAGNPVHTSSVRVSASGHNTEGAPSITTTDPNLLLVHLIATGSAASISSQSTTSGLAYPYNSSPDLQVATQNSRNYTSQASGGGTAIGMAHWMKTIPGPTGDGYSNSTVSAEHVSIFAAFTPETAAATSGTRYYLSTKYPSTYLWGELAGEWDSVVWGPRPEVFGQLCELTQLRSDAGYAWNPLLSNNLKEHAVLFNRWVTPPLAAQTISGTFDVTLHSGCGWTGGVQTDDDPTLSTGVFRVYLYVTVGDSTTVRGVLLDYTDPSSNKLLNDGLMRFQGLATPQTLTSQTVTAGDRVMVEIGVYIVDSPMPEPNFIPDEWTYIALDLGTMGNAEGWTGDNGIPQLDGVNGPTYQPYRSSHLNFSHTFVEQTYSGTIPTNVTRATAAPITLSEHIGPVDTTHVPVANRELWYTWTAPASQRVIVHLWGSYYMPGLNVYSGADATGFVLIPDAGDEWTFTSRVVQQFDAVLGTIYYFRLRTLVHHEEAAPATGGELHLTLLPYLAPQNNDLFLASAGYVMCFREGTLINVMTSFAGLAIAGLAIDYTERPMVDYEDDSTHTGHRLYVSLFHLNMVEVLDLATLSTGRTEIDWIVDPLTDSPRSGPLSLAITSTGTLIIGRSGDGFRRVAGEGDASSFQAFQDRVSSAGAAGLMVIDASHGDNQPDAPWPASTLYDVTLEGGGTNRCEVAADDATVYYISADLYVPAGGGHVVRRFDISAGVQLADFATVPANSTYVPSIKGVFPLPDGGLLVCNGDHVARLNSSGAVTQTYTPTPAIRYRSLSDVQLTSEGESFWVLDENSTSLAKFNLETGAQLNDTWTQIGFGASQEIVVYRTEPMPVVEHVCITAPPQAACWNPHDINALQIGLISEGQP